jgi:hypothetical protein
MKNLNISHSIAFFFYSPGLQLVILLQVLERTPDGDCQRYAAKQVGSQVSTRYAVGFDLEKWRWRFEPLIV